MPWLQMFATSSLFFVPVPKTAVEVDGLSICELCTASIMVVAGSGLVCCWVGWTKAVAWLCCRLRIGCVVWMLGLVERTEPLVLPKTVTCSIGLSVDWRADGTNQWQFTTYALIKISYQMSKPELHPYLPAFPPVLWAWLWLWAWSQVRVLSLGGCLP